MQYLTGLSGEHLLFNWTPGYLDVNHANCKLLNDNAYLYAEVTLRVVVLLCARFGLCGCFLYQVAHVCTY